MFVTRFAPSPTGYLHLGHAFSALTAFDAAKVNDGTCLLRIEDMDVTRCKPTFETAIYEDLAWLGMTWPTPVLRQSEHMSVYAEALLRLQDMGVVYRCFRTRKELLVDSAHAPHGFGEAFYGAPLPEKEERALLEQGKPYAWRLSLARAKDRLSAVWADLAYTIDGQITKITPERLGDIVLARKEFPASYHLASVVDDARQGVTHIIRGIDLLDAPHIQVVLQALLGLPTPTYQHHRLITDESGRRLAKRDQAATLRAVREAGATSKDVRAMVGLPT